jgi:hypothetical protein
VSDIGALSLAHPDSHHLEQTALMRSREIGVMFDSVDDDDAIGVCSELVSVNGDAIRLADSFNFHRCQDGSADEFFGDAVVPQNGDLTFSSRTTMTSHRWENERLATALFQELNNAFDDFVDASNAATARRDSDALSFQFPAQPNSFQLSLRLRNYIVNSLAVKPLGYASHSYLLQHSRSLRSPEISANSF